MSEHRRHDRFEVDGKVLAKQPPFVLTVCQAPNTANVGKPCGHPAATCKGTVGLKCQDCAHDFCEYHITAHKQRVLAPPDSFKSYRAWLAGQVKARLDGQKRGPRPVHSWQGDDDD